MRDNRLGTHLWMLAGPVLVAVLGMPSDLQAQALTSIPDPPMLVFADGVFTATLTPADQGAPSGYFYRILYTHPDGTEDIMMRPEADEVPANPSTASQRIDADSARYDHGRWRFLVQLYREDPMADAVDEDSTGREVARRFPERPGGRSTAVLFTLGPPPAPKNFYPAPLPPGGYVLTWQGDSASADLGIEKHEFRAVAVGTAAVDLLDWKPATRGSIVYSGMDALEPGEYAFMLRAVGTHSNERADVERDGSVPGAVAMVSVTVGAPVPTLPETVTWFLALLFVGSGVFLLRPRSTSLTRA